MLTHVLLRLVGGKELWISMRAASSLYLETMILIIDTFTCILQVWNLPIMLILWGI